MFLINTNRKKSNTNETQYVLRKVQGTNIYKVLFANSARTTFGFPYFNQFLKLLQRFTVFTILRYHGPYLGFWKFDRLDAIVCCFYVFPPELASVRTEIIVWLLKVILVSLFQVISVFPFYVESS